jgi:hypothetical protein
MMVCQRTILLAEDSDDAQMGIFFLMMKERALR